MTATVTGFLEEAPGVRSMARLAVLLQSIGILALTIAIAAYLLFAKQLTGAAPDAAVLGTTVAPLGALASGIFGALKQRTPAGDA